MEIGKHHHDCAPTEYAGAVAIAPFRETMHTRIVRLFVARGVEGFTDEELVRAYTDQINPDAGSSYRGGASIGARRNELVEKGVLIDSGRERVSRAGVQNIVWIHTSFVGVCA